MQRCVNSPDRVLVVGSRRFDGVLVDHPESAARERQRKDGNDGRAGSQRERGQSRSRRCGTIEEVDVDGVGRLHVLIDQERDGLVGFERAQHAPDRAAPIEHGITSRRPNGLEQIVQQRVVERPRQHRHRLDRQRVDQRVDFPEAEMSGEKQHAAVLRVRVDHAIFAFELDARQHLVGAHGAEFQQHDEQPAEVRKHVAADRAALRFGPHGKRGAQILDRQPAVAAIEHIERAAEQRACREHRAHRQQPDQRDDAGHAPGIRAGAEAMDAGAPAPCPLEAIAGQPTMSRAARSEPASQCRNSGSGSGSIVSAAHSIAWETAARAVVARSPFRSSG